MTTGSPRSLADEVLARCDRLAACTEEPGRITRLFLCESAREVHRLVSEWMGDAGLAVRIDALGNLIGRRPGPRDDSPVFVIGSHLDTVPDAGKYDGILGVLLSIAAVERLRGTRLPFAIDVVGFSEEEGIRFRASYLGSKAFAGTFDAQLLERVDAAGISMATAIRAFGLDLTAIPAAAVRRGSVVGYLETHIEQGPVLEAKNLPLGVVEAIAGQSRYWLHFFGKAGHAGTQPMELRRDALVAAAEFVIAVERTARSVDGLRATVGTMTVAPGATNVVPGSVRLSLDVRHRDDAVRRHAIEDLFAAADAIAKKRGIGLGLDRHEEHPAVASDARLTSLLAESAESLGHRPLRMVSGAGHDAVVMADLCPMTMLFVRSVGGISHHPDEAVHAADVHAALDVMVAFLERLAGDSP